MKKKKLGRPKLRDGMHRNVRRYVGLRIQEVKKLDELAGARSKTFSELAREVLLEWAMQLQNQ